MNSTRLTARASFATAEPLQAVNAEAAEGNLQWMPPGPQDITCWVNGQPRRLQFTVTAAHAELLDAQLQRMLARAKAGRGDKPLTDYNHDDAAASGRPVRFTWGGDDPKTGGLRLGNKWTGKAKASIKDEEFDRFSPQWEFDENTGEITGIGVNLGGLVNKAAFQNISQVQARDATGALAIGAAAETDADDPAECNAIAAKAHKASSKALVAGPEDAVNAHTDAHKAHLAAADAMKAAGNKDEAATHKDLAAHHKSKALEIAKTNLAAASAAASSANNPPDEKGITEEKQMNDQEIATAVAKGVEAAIKPLGETISALGKKVEALETSTTAQTKEATAAAKSAVQKHVARGALAPQDTKAIAFWEAAHVANAADAEEQLGKIAVLNRGRVIPAGTNGTITGQAEEPEARIIAAASGLRSKNPTAFASDAAALEATLRTKQGREDYEQFRNDIASGVARGKSVQVNRS